MKKSLIRALALLLVISALVAVFTVTIEAASYATGKYVITAKSGLNMRSGPGTSYSKVTAIPKNTVVNVTKISGAWGYTTYNNRSGWISMEYTQRYSAPTASSSSFRATSGWNVNAGGVIINAGDIFYTWNRSGTQKSTSGNYNVYAYAKVKGSLVYVASAQCMAFARYTQELLYGANDGTDASRFNKQYYSNYSQQTASYIKKIVTAAGNGAHLRVKYNGHSMVVVNVDNNGFYYIDANAGNKANQVCIGYITWNDFKSQWKNIYMISTFKG